MSKQIHIFATRSDLEPGLKGIEQKHKLRYVPCGLFETENFQSYKSLLEFDGLGFNPKGDHVKGDRFLIVNSSVSIQVRKVAQKVGGFRYAIDQLVNPKSIVFSPGGICESNDLVCGHIGTVSTDVDSSALYREFTGAIKRGFEHIKNYWVGPEASRLLGGGKRLITASIDSPRDYDLRRPDSGQKL